MDEYEIEDSMKNTPTLLREESEMFCNSQDFFMTDDNIKLLSQEDDKDEKGDNGKCESNVDKDKNNVDKNVDKDKYINDINNDNDSNSTESSDSVSSIDIKKRRKPIRRTSMSIKKTTKGGVKKKKEESEESKKEVKKSKTKGSKESKENKKNKKNDSSKESKEEKQEEKISQDTKESKEEKISQDTKQEDIIKEDIVKEDIVNEDIIKEDTKQDSKKSYNLTPDETKIFDFLYNINRPVSSTELQLNFKKQITGPSLQNICTNLVEKGLIILKIYTKTKIFMISPSVFDMSEMDTNIEKLKALNIINEDLKKEYQSKVSELKNYKSMDTEEELNMKIEEIEKDLKIIRERVKLRDEGELVSKKEIEEYKEKTKKYIKIKKERSKILNEILGTLCENLNMKKKELIEELELEM